MYFFRHLLLSFFLIIFMPCLVFTQQSKSVVLKKTGEIANVRLKPDYAYYLFEANQDYLAWYEGYTGTLFVYKFSKNELKEIHLKEGRGPNEYKQISDLAISNKNIIYLNDPTNAKLIRITHSGVFLEDQNFPPGTRPSNIYIRNTDMIILDIFNQESVLFNYVEGKVEPISLGRTKVLEEFTNLFQKEGYLTIQNNNIIHLTKYYPHIYIYDSEENNLIKKIKFDESEIQEGRTSTTEEGVKAITPPAKVDILSEDVAYIPGTPGRIFLLAKGASDNRDYDLDKLYEYDFENEEFVAAHDLGVKATEITVNDNYLFVYSEEENEIFRYEIVSSE